MFAVSGSDYELNANSRLAVPPQQAGLPAEREAQRGRLRIYAGIKFDTYGIAAECENAGQAKRR